MRVNLEKLSTMLVEDSTYAAAEVPPLPEGIGKVANTKPAAKWRLLKSKPHPPQSNIFAFEQPSGRF